VITQKSFHYELILLTELANQQAENFKKVLSPKNGNKKITEYRTTEHASNFAQ
jgi:hypothetical protein